MAIDNDSGLEIIRKAGELVTPGDASDAYLKVGPTPGNPIVPSFFTKSYDAIRATYPTSTQEVYETLTGGILGTVVQTLTVNYTDASKKNFLNAAVVG